MIDTANLLPDSTQRPLKLETYHRGQFSIAGTYSFVGGSYSHLILSSTETVSTESEKN